MGADRGADDDVGIPVFDPLRTFPADLAAIILLTVATILAVFLPVVRETPLRIILGLPFVLFVPGYALVAALFPETGASSRDELADESDASPGEDGATGGLRAHVTDRSGIDGIERVALSFGLSIAVVPLLGLVLNFTPFGIRLVPIVVTLTLFTFGAVAVADWRRRQLPTDERFRVPYDRWITEATSELLQPDSRTDAALNVLLVLSILIAAGSVGYAVAVPKDGEQFTEFYLLTENETGDLVADDYPTEFVQGEGKPIVVGIGNHEGTSVSYTVIIELQRVRLTDNGTTVTVLEKQELRRYSQRVAANDTAHRTVMLRPTLTGERLRLVFLLYQDTPPATPAVDTAYRETHLWVNVSASSS